MSRTSNPQYREYQKAYHAKYDAAYYQRNKRRIIDRKAAKRKEKQDWFRSFKLTLSCIKCGESCINCLEFHHKNPETKEYSVGDMISSWLSIEAIKKEIEKCEVLCANCHRKLHCKCKACLHA